MRKWARSMSKFAEKVNKWYKSGLWSLRMVRDALEKGKITQEEYDEIVGADE